MVDLIDEIKHELKEEKLFKALKAIMPWFIAFSVIAVTTTAIFVFYNNYQESKDKEFTEQFYKLAMAYNEGNDEAFKEAKANISKLDEQKYKNFVTLLSARKLVRDDQAVEALKLYEELIKQQLPLEIRDKVIIEKIMIEYKINPENYNQIIQQVKTIEPTSPLYFSAIEVAILISISTNHIEEGKKLINELLAENIPDSTRNRIALLQNYYKLKADNLIN